MVKWRMPGKNLTVRICNGMYQGDTTYDNAITKLPLKEIEPFILKEEELVKDKPVEEVKEEDKEVEKEETEQELKARLKKDKTVRELKTVCKDLKLTGYSNLNEDKLIDLLVENGYKG